MAAVQRWRARTVSSPTAVRPPAIVLVRVNRLGELSRQKLAEVIEDAWLSQASARRVAQRGLLGP